MLLMKSHSEEIDKKVYDNRNTIAASGTAEDVLVVYHQLL